MYFLKYMYKRGFFLLRHFGHLSRDSIKTRCGSFHQTTFLDIMTELTELPSVISKTSICYLKMTEKINPVYKSESSQSDESRARQVDSSKDNTHSRSRAFNSRRHGGEVPC